MIGPKRQDAQFTHTFWRRWLICFGVIVLSATMVSATENGASVWPVGVETVLTGLQPPPGKTMGYEYSCFYAANEFDNGKGKSSLPEFKLRVLATAFKVTHNWGLHFLGGTVDSQIAVPLIYQQLHVPPGKFEKFAIGNADFIPFNVSYHTGPLHWYYEADFFLPGSGYSAGNALNIGQHNIAAGPVAGFTYLPKKGQYEFSSRLTYLLNGSDNTTHYHSGNEFTWEFNADRELSRKVAVGVNGYLFKQTTDDHQNGLLYEGGFRGRDLAIGPQIRFPLGKHGGFAVKYYRDTLVQNRPRGNAVWFQIAIPMGFGDHGEHANKPL
jgi:hypothetical protein